MADGYNFTFNVTETSYSAISNTSNVSVNIVCNRPSNATGAWSNYSSTLTVNCDGQKKTKTISSYDFRNYSKLDMGTFTFTITHNSDGSKTVSISADWNTTNSALNSGNGVQGSTSKKLTTLDRNAPSLSIAFYSKTYNSLTFSLLSNGTCDIVQYRINSGDWVNTGFGLTANTSRTLTVTGLSPNTSYKIEFQVRKTVNQLYSIIVSNNQTTNKPNAPSKGIVSIGSITYKSMVATINNFSFGVGATWGYYEYRLNDDDWKNIGQNNQVTLNNLLPNTNYTITVRLVDNYGSISGNASAIGKTNLPPSPSGGTITIGEITPFTIAITYDGFAAGDMASISRYDVACYTGSPNYINNGLNKNYTFINLKAETTYTIAVRVVDNYGQTRTITINATTLQDQAKSFFNIGTWKKGKNRFKTSGNWHKVIKIYYKQNGHWRANK